MPLALSLAEDVQSKVPDANGWYMGGGAGDGAFQLTGGGQEFRTITNIQIGATDIYGNSRAFEFNRMRVGDYLLIWQSTNGFGIYTIGALTEQGAYWDFGLAATAFAGTVADGVPCTFKLLFATPGASAGQIVFSVDGLRTTGSNNLVFNGTQLVLGTDGGVELVIKNGAIKNGAYYALNGTLGFQVGSGGEFVIGPAGGGIAGQVLTVQVSGPPTWTSLTTASIPASSNANYVTDAQLAVIVNTSGTNSGDQDLSSYATSAAVTAAIGSLGLGTMSQQNVGATADVAVLAPDGTTTITLHFVNGIFSGAS